MYSSIVSVMNWQSSAENTAMLETFVTSSSTLVGCSPWLYSMLLIGAFYIASAVILSFMRRNLGMAVVDLGMAEH